MRLGIDGREIQNGVYTGIGRALYNFLHHFSSAHHDDRCIVFSSRPLPFKFGEKIVNHVMEEDWSIFWDQLQLTFAIKRHEIQVFYSPYPKVPLLSSCTKVCSVLDLIGLRYPAYAARLTAREEFLYNTAMPRFFRSSDKILTCSSFSRDEIVRVYGVDRSMIEVIPLSAASFYKPEPDHSKVEACLATFGMRGRYILYAGNFKEHKNVSTLVAAFAFIAGKFPDMTLVLEAPKEGLYTQILAEARKFGIENRVVFTGRVTDQETSRLLYAGASVFVMPSLYEGFGLPPVEAMACGTPVVSSSETSLIEVVEGASLMVDPRDPHQMSAAIEKVLTDDVLRADLVSKGRRRAVDFEEGRIASRMYDLFKGLAK